MMQEVVLTQNIENDGVVRCEWCCGDSCLNIGTGMFRDVDSDTSYGIPVCSGCGGLGFGIPEDKVYQALREQVFTLRFEYCPQDSLPKPPHGARLASLRALIETVTKIYTVYGRGAECFAQRIASGYLDEIVNTLQEYVEGQVAMIDGAPLDPGAGRTELSRSAMIAALRNDLERADELYKRLLGESPECSIAQHDYASYLIRFRRNAEAAVGHFMTSCEMEPVKAFHFVQTGRCLDLLNRRDEAIAFYMRASEAPDFEQIPSEDREAIQVLIDEHLRNHPLDN